MSDLSLSLEIRLLHVFMLDNGGSPEPNRRRPISMKGVVDEVIRQMEWARRQGAHAGAPYLSGRENIDVSIAFHRLLKEVPLLTLAPEDWKP